MKLILTLAIALFALGNGSAQQAPKYVSPAETATGTIGGATIVVKYGAPSVHGRQMFGEGGRIMKDPTAPIWRAGANTATAFHTDADLDIAGLAVPKGDYTIFVDVKNPDAWIFILNKQTGQWGLTYNAAEDLGRVPMKMSKPPALVETLHYTISASGPKQGKLQMEWENHIASVPITVK